MTRAELETICRDHGIAVSLTGHVNERGAALILDVCSETLRQWRLNGRPPRPVRLGGRWRYHVDALATVLTPVQESQGTHQKSQGLAGDDARVKADDTAVFPKRAAKK